MLEKFKTKLQTVQTLSDQYGEEEEEEDKEVGREAEEGEEEVETDIAGDGW